MVSKKVKIINEQGFHMRPANDFVREMAKFKSDIHLVMGEKDVNGKSIMNIMAACIKYGSEIEVRCDGEDEQAMLDKAVEMISSGLGEV
ncbi:MAG TPA: HPr family phosphocarrier protein [Candidatus Onthovicinus excrementipullorum]|nr:HPr family phosphocarrier protein [Candidatus Onthovicinus excrementipullorum]